MSIVKLVMLLPFFSRVYSFDFRPSCCYSVLLGRMDHMRAWSIQFDARENDLWMMVDQIYPKLNRYVGELVRAAWQ